MSNDTQTLTLTEFLLARIAEDEEYLGRHVGPRGFTNAYEDNLWQARVLAECEAKRRIVEAAIEVEEHEGGSASMVMLGCSYTPGVLPLLAAIYADHPDYRDEWKP